MTLSTSHPHAKQRWALLVGVVGVLTLLVGSVVLASPSNYLERGDTNIRFNSTPGSTFDWANSGPNRTTSAAGVVNVSGSGGIFDGGIQGANKNTPPTAPGLTAAAQAAKNAGSIVDADFIVDPLSSDDTVACDPGDPTTFAGAGSETNNGRLDTFTYGTSGNTPPKNDLSNVYALATNVSDHNEIFFAAERVVNNGDSHIDFEFLQSQVRTGTNPCAGTFAPAAYDADSGLSINNRTQGDLLLSVDFTNGGTLGGKVLYRWQCDRTYNASHDGTICNPPANGKSVSHYEALPSGSPLLDNLAFGVNAQGAVAGGGWEHRNSDGTARADVVTNAFMEGAIDLTGLGFEGCIQTLLPHTRSSQSFTAVLKDFANVEFDTCVSPSITTQIQTSDNTNVDNEAELPIGSVLHDTAALHGATSDAGGTVNYKLYTDDECTIASTDPALDDTKDVTNGVVAASDNITFNSTGTFYFQATYSGDTDSGGKNHGPVSSVCTSETVTITQYEPTIATQVKLDSDDSDVASGTEVAIGTTVYDTATLAGASPSAGGTVTYNLYTDDACSVASTDPALSDEVDVTDGGVPDSTSVTFDHSGTWYFQATYSGDTFNKGPVSSDCSTEIVVVVPNEPTIATQVKLDSDGSDVASGTEVAIGTTVYDTATLSGATGDAGGTVTYNLYTDDQCSIASTAPALSDEVNVTDGDVPDSTSVTFDHSGTWYFQATYSGDDNNVGPVSSDCSTEIVVVVPNEPSLTTTPAVKINDSATLSGLTADASGTLTFQLFGPENATCDPSDIAWSDEHAVDGNVVNGGFSASTEYQAATSGTWRWIVIYDGDDNNVGTTSGCNDETVDVMITVFPAEPIGLIE